jgi:hypothetical protein
MSKIGLVLILMLLSGKSHAQQDYFILIQADNNQPFYVLRGDKSLSSSAQGHLILSQLKEGGYAMTIGFPGKLFPEQHYTIPVQGRDLEFQLKNLGDKGWGLFNPQSLELKMPDKKGERVGGAGPEGIRKDDAFSRLMAGVVSDTAVMYNTYAMDKVLNDSPALVARQVGPGAGTIQPDTISMRTDTALRTDTARAEVKTPVLPPGDTAVVVRTAQPILDSAAASPPQHTTGLVVKLSERKNTRNWRGVYADRVTGKKADTIIVIIPVDTAADRQAAQPDHKILARKTADTTRPGATAGEPSLGSPVLTPQPVAAETAEKKTPARLVVANSDCKNFATDYDVDKLRVKMLEAGKDEDRIATAKKIFKTRCFTTRQIRALSEVFTTDAAKYRFFETAYPFVSDDRFSELASLLADPVYNGKFKAMTGQQ